jgi:Flp pilus assembly protein TadB
LASPGNSKKDASRRSENIIRLVAVALIAVLFVLLIIGLNFFIWIAVVLIVALVANSMLRRMKKRQQTSV